MRINNQITASSVRLIDENGKQLGVVDLDKALQIAGERLLDLVEVAPDSKPIVCKLLDYGKHAFLEKKKRHESKTRQRRTLVKEVKFRMSTGESDYRIKLRNIGRFLEAGDKVKVSIWFRGREIVHHRLASKVIDRLKDDLEGKAVLESEPLLEGKRMNLMFAPVKAKPKDSNGAAGANGAAPPAAAKDG